MASPLTPTIIMPSYVCKSGGLFLLHIGTDPMTPAYPTAVNANVDFWLDDDTEKVSVIPEWSLLATPSKEANRNSWVGFQPYRGTTPIICTPQTRVRFKAPADWMKTAKGPAEAQEGMLENYAGRDEPGVFGYVGFGPPDSWKKLKPGFQGAGYLAYSTGAYRNLIHRIPNPCIGALTSTDDGIPLAFGSSGLIDANIWNSTANGIDNRQFPAPPGTWRFRARETNPDAPITVTLLGNVPALITNARVAQLADGFKLWEWDVAIAPEAYNNTLTLRFTAPIKRSGQPFTLQSLAATQGGDDMVDAFTPENDYSDNYARMLTAAPGVGFGCHRNLNMSWPDVSRARVEELPNPMANSLIPKTPTPAAVWTESEPGRTGPRVLVIDSIQPYDLATSPNVYHNINLLTAEPSDNPAIAPFMVNLAKNGLAYDWYYKTGSNTKQVIFEIAFRKPHNLISNQMIRIPSPFTFAVKNSLGTGTASIPGGNGLYVVQVTGANTVIAMTVTNLTSVADAAQVDGPQAIAGDKTATYTNPSAVAVAHTVSPSRVSNTPPWVCINHAWSDDAVLLFAQQMWAVMGTDKTAYLQISNEPLISSNVQHCWSCLASLQGMGWNNPEHSVVRRSAEVWAIFDSVWGDSKSKLIRLFQPFTLDPMDTIKGFKYADANSIRIDAFTPAPYEIIDQSFKMAGARIAADNPDSIAHPLNGGSGILCPIPVYADIAKHDIKYGRVHNGPTSSYALQLKARDSSGYGTGNGPTGFKAPMPYMIGYEGVLGDAIAPGVSEKTKTLRPGLSHDIMSHPVYRDIIESMLAHLQQPGPEGTEGFRVVAINNLCGPRTFTAIARSFPCPDGLDGYSVALWSGRASWQGQRPGYGLNNKLWITDGKQHEHENESVSGQAFADWMVAVHANENPLPPDPPVPQIGVRVALVDGKGTEVASLGPISLPVDSTWTISTSVKALSSGHEG